jgi:hypothetical protein
MRCVLPIFVDSLTKPHHTFSFCISVKKEENYDWQNNFPDKIIPVSKPTLIYVDTQ